MERGANSWGAYWRGAAAAGATAVGGAKDAALARFWTAFLEPRLAPGAGARALLEIACGAGDVARRARSLADAAGAELSVFCTDYSLAAAGGARGRIADAAAFAADAGALPVRAGAVDFAVSQFGLEYAGPGAFAEAARCVAAGGAFAAVVHMKGGAIERECAENARLLAAMRDSALLECAETAFAAGYAMTAGKAGEADYQQADKALAWAVDKVREILTASPGSAARAFLARLYQDLAQMYPRARAYAPADVAAFLKGAIREAESYEARMRAMLGAAQSEDDIRALLSRLERAGFAMAAPQILEMGDAAAPAAWALSGTRAG